MRASGISLILFSVILYSCQQEDVLPKDKEEFAQSLFDGTVIENQSDNEEGESVWKLKLENEEGAVVELYIAKSEDRIVRIDGKNGPFTYDIDPKLSLKTFSQAKIAAVTALKNDKLQEWQLKKEDKYQGDFIYTLKFDADSNEDVVEVDGKSGVILSVD